MKYFSHTNPNKKYSFQEAILNSTAPDGGLFMPEKIPQIDKDSMINMSFVEIAYHISRLFVSDIDDQTLKNKCQQSYSFFPFIQQLEENHSILELFHGPTAAFKDFSAAWMSRIVEYFLEREKKSRNILVATSGDTGGAIGYAFSKNKHTRVFILYPEKGVSKTQEQQMTSLGESVFALKVQGDFDDCQRLVKEAFMDKKNSRKFSLMSANSINIGRIIPQSFYYIWSSLQQYKQNPQSKITYAIPSGNLGNFMGAILAQAMGAPIHHLIAANNINRPFYDFLKSGIFTPNAAIPTIANAMDIGHPNNFYRILSFFHGSIHKIRENISGYFSDEEDIHKGITDAQNKYHLTLCPHSAIGYQATQNFQNKADRDKNYFFYTVATAHPAKFLPTMQSINPNFNDIPERLNFTHKSGKSHKITAHLKDIEKFLTKHISIS